ncbi:hypothetical protein Mapa_016041 [Marchantia paleacea]|nr:hypothetical protein Mapa_016041 [Marchantia paleacea]
MSCAASTVPSKCFCPSVASSCRLSPLSMLITIVIWSDIFSNSAVARKPSPFTGPMSTTATEHFSSADLESTPQAP